jgi:hypothetical protein
LPIRRPSLLLLLFAAVLLSAGPAAGQPIPPVATTDSVDSPEPEFSPRGAFFRSLVLPGWGQAYVGSPGRGAVYFALAGSSAWMAYVARRQQADARAQQAWLRESGQIEQTDETGIFVARAQQFEDWTALSIFLFFFAGADAYVAAYLADFDERMGVVPSVDGSLQFRASVPLSWPR